MHFPSSTFGFILVILISGGISPGVRAEPGKPRLHSIRPIVPIKQSIRGSAEQTKSQTLSVKIPPPPIPENTPAALLSPPTIPEPALVESTLPPEPAATDESPIPAKEPDNADSPPETPSAETSPETEAETDEPKAADTPKEADKPKKADGPTLEQLRAEAHALADQKLSYIFGAEDPESGGLDCSSTIQYLLTKIGIKDVPRTSYDQYDWLKEKGLLDDVYGKSSQDKLFKKLSPGDIIFWGGTWDSGHRVSHVMLYLGYDKTTDKHYIFGARGKSVKGLTGCGVDIFDMKSQKGRLIAHGKIPGLVY